MAVTALVKHQMLQINLVTFQGAWFVGFAALFLLRARLRGSRGVGPARALSPLLSPPAAPHFPEPLGDVTVEAGDSASLLCRVEGSPAPQVAWSRQDGKPVTGWQGPRGVSSRLEAAELLIHSKRAERALARWAACVGVPPGCTLTPCHPWVLLPSLLQVDVPAVGLAPVFTLLQ